MNAWMHINTNGKVTIFSHRAEMGQGAYQAIPQMVAEELEVHLDEVNIVFAKGDNKKYGSQITGGSSTVRGSYKNLLNLGAIAREMLIEAAALKWQLSWRIPHIPATQPEPNQEECGNTHINKEKQLAVHLISIIG